MKALLIGGTGTISSAISRLALEKGWELTLLNRGNRAVPQGAEEVRTDIADEQSVAKALAGRSFDVVADFLTYTVEQVERDRRLFEGKTAQYIAISSASAYQKPLASPFITESTPLCNPFWQYSRDKIAVENALTEAYRQTDFPVTIVRPSHTYGDFSVPVAIHGPNGSFSVVERIRTGRKVIVPGDGLTLWTLTHNSDFAKAFVGLMGNPHAIGETYQITSDESLTWNQVYETIGAALGVKPRMVHIASETLSAWRPELEGGLLGDKANSVVFSNEKIKRTVPEYCATTRFAQGVRRTLEYVYSHPECQKKDEDFDAWTDLAIEKYESLMEARP